MNFLELLFHSKDLIMTLFLQFLVSYANFYIVFFSWSPLKDETLSQDSLNSSEDSQKTENTPNKKVSFCDQVTVAEVY